MDKSYIHPYAIISVDLPFDGLGFCVITEFLKSEMIGITYKISQKSENLESFHTLFF